MKKIVPITCFLLMAVAARAQNKEPRLELYMGGGFFLEHLNNDTLVPAKRRNQQRLGDVASFGVQAALPMGNSRWLIKGGVGYSERHYSLNKYSIGDFIGNLFLFDSRSRIDSSIISFVRFTNQYLQVPIAISYQITKRKHGLGAFTAGLNVRSDFLLKSKPEMHFDSAFPLPDAPTTATYKKLYTQNASPYVITVEPYLEVSFFVYKGIGMYLQSRPFSFYSSPLNSRFTTGGTEIFSATFGIMYDFDRR